MNARLLPSQFRADLQFSGRLRVAGIVDELGTPGKYRVVLFDRALAKAIRQVYSAKDGSYSFDWLADRDYFAVAFDHGDSQVNAAVADFLPLEPMP